MSRMCVLIADRQCAATHKAISIIMPRRKFAAHNHVQKFNPLTYKSIETHPHILEACVVSECCVIVVVNTEAVMCLSLNACADQRWQIDWTLLPADLQGNAGLMMFAAVDITKLPVISIKLRLCFCHNTCAVLQMPSVSFSVCHLCFSSWPFYFRIFFW